MRAALLVVALSATGCGAAGQLARTTGQNAANGAVAAVTTPANEKAIDDLATKAATDAAKGAAGAAVSELFGPRTKSGVQDLAVQLRSELLAARAELLDEKFVDALRERLVGAPLREDVDALIDDATPKLALAVSRAVEASVVPVEAKAREDASLFGRVAVGLAVAVAALLIALALAVYEIRRHRAELKSILALKRRS